LAGICAVLQGCATPALDTSQLSIYSDNRVGYTIAEPGNSSVRRVWSSGDTVLALRFGKRLINAKDIDSIVVQQTRKPYVPLHIAVRLSSNESLIADVHDWGNSAYSDVMIEWMACTKTRACEYLDRTGSSRGALSFKNTPRFLMAIDEAQFDNVVGDKTVKDFITYAGYSDIPSSSSVSLNFDEADRISDLRAGMEIARQKRARVEKCVSDRIAEQERTRNSLTRTGFSQTLTAGIGCR
jgi:hypothetical protein